MSLSKIPLIIATAWAYKISLTDPNPPPPASELSKPATVFETRWYMQYIPKSIVVITLALSLLELVTIVGNMQNSPLRPLLTLTVMAGGNPKNLTLTPNIILGAFLMVSAVLLRLWCYSALGTLFRFEASIQKNHQLITSGPYAIVRHPSYTGMLLLHSGWFLWHLSSGSWVRECGMWESVWGKLFIFVFTVLGIWIPLYLLLSRMSSEDAALRREFGKNWDRYAERVRYYLVPGVY